LTLAYSIAPSTLAVDVLLVPREGVVGPD